MRPLLFITAGLLIVGQALADCVLMENKAENKVVIENEYLKVTLAPGLAGKATSILYKRANADLTCAGAEGGCFADRLWEAQDYLFPKASYTCRIAENTPERAAVLLSARGTGLYEGLRLEKTIALQRGKSYLQVDYKVVNTGAAPLPVGLWFQHFIGNPKEKLFLYSPTPEGPNKCVLAPGQLPQSPQLAGQDQFIYGTPEGWQAALNEQGAGAAFVFDARYVSCTYNFVWTGIATTEWCLNEIELETNAVLATSVILLPLNGFRGFSGASGTLAAWIDAKPMMAVGETIPVTLNLLSGENRNVEVLFYDAFGGQNPRLVDKRPATLKADELQGLAFKYSTSRSDTHVFQFVVQANGKTIATFWKPIGVETAIYVHRLAPPEKIGKEMARYRNRTKAALDQAAANKPSVSGYIPTQAVVTPHIAWAKPFRHTLKTLFIEPAYYTREVIELAQRLSLDFDVAALEGNFYERTKNKYGLTRLDKLLLETKLTNTYDCIVLGRWLNWESFPDTIKALFEAQFQKGAGIVWIDPQDFPCEKGDSNLATNLLATTGKLCAPKITIGRRGKSTCLMLVWPKIHTKRTCLVPLEADYDTALDPALQQEYTFSLLAKALVLASGKAPDIAIVAVDLRANTLTLNSKAAGPVKVLVDFRGKDGEILSSCARELNVEQGTAAYDLSLANIPGGENIMDISLRGPDGKVINWQSLLYSRDYELGMAAALEQTVCRPADKPQMRLNIENRRAGKRNVSLQTEIRDTFARSFNRNTKEITLAPGTNALTLTADMAGIMTRSGYAGVKVFEGEKLLNNAALFFTLKQNLDEPFRLVHSGTSLSTGFMWHTYKNAGADTVIWALAPEIAVRHNLDVLLASGIPGWIDGWHPEPGLTIRKPCLTDPAYLKQVEDWAVNGSGGAHAMSACQALGNICNDEWGYGGEGNQASDFCHSATCRQGFREFLKQDYGSLAELNREWETSFKSFDEIEPPRNADVKEKKLYPQWVDHRRYVEFKTADFFRRLNAAARPVYPEARFGLYGTPQAGSWHGYDWSKLARQWGAVSTYGGTQVELVRSMFADNAFVSQWWNPSFKPIIYRVMPWFMLFRGMEGFILGYADVYGFNAPDLTFGPETDKTASGAALTEEFRTIKSGVAHLLKRARRDDQKIAIHYSQSSIHAATLDDMKGTCPGFELYSSGLAALLGLLQDMGLAYKFVAYEQIEAGELERGGYKILIMPYSQSVSAREAEAIKTFARKGGLVIADLRAGLYDRHGKKLPAPALDDLFGLTRKGENAGFADGTLTIEKDHPVIKLKDKNLSVKKGDAGITPAGAIPLARFDEEGAPAMLVNSFGQGHGVYLNFMLTPYKDQRSYAGNAELNLLEKIQVEKADALRELFYRIFELAGVKPRLGLFDARGQRLFKHDLTVFDDQDCAYFGIVQQDDFANLRVVTNALLQFPEKAHIYEIRAGKSYGFTDKLTLDLGPDPALFAALPGKLEAIALDIEPQYARGATLAYRVGLKKNYAGNTVLGVKMTGPEGQEYWLHASRIVIPERSFQGSIPLAWNMPAGRYTLAVTDTVTKLAARKTFEVK